MSKCWEHRGCDEEMQGVCPHPNELKDNCPTKCAFATCDHPQHAITTDPELVFDPDVDRSVVLKDNCRFCVFFLRNGPRLR
ncbi:MAG: hypothetical protein M1617_00855 [Actinobacteria bacterium]|nr:hypothetical protein [Actinomycetota bacterium]